jgi:hypothetical protein
MIDATLPTMIDEVLISAGKFEGSAVATAPAKRHLKASECHWVAGRLALRAPGIKLERKS